MPLDCNEMVVCRSIPAEMREAAAVDGARPWRLLWKIELSLMRPSVFVALFTQFSSRRTQGEWPHLVVSSISRKSAPGPNTAVGLHRQRGYVLGSVQACEDEGTSRQVIVSDADVGQISSLAPPGLASALGSKVSIKRSRNACHPFKSDGNRL